jgi:hypothetical protein
MTTKADFTKTSETMRKGVTAPNVSPSAAAASPTPSGQGTGKAPGRERRRASELVRQPPPADRAIRPDRLAQEVETQTPSCPAATLAAKAPDR